MHRREFIKYGAASLLTLTCGRPAWSSGPVGSAVESVRQFNLSIKEIIAEMIDGEEVFMLAFSALDHTRVPGPVLRVTEGETVEITVYNGTGQQGRSGTTHKLEIPGVASSALVAPSETVQLQFTAPSAGTYLYLDPLNAPVNRMLGLHGVMIVEPREGRTALGSLTPYSTSKHTPAVAALFDAFGRDATHFPGEAWNAARQLVWQFHQIDPKFHKLAERGETINALQMQQDFLARYFTINGVSGFEAAHDPTIVATGFVGQPMLIRNVNMGLNWHSPHIHGNHVYEVASVIGGASEDLAAPYERAFAAPTGPAGGVALRNNLIYRDVWTLAPLDRKDVVIPYVRPPDIPISAYPPSQETVLTRAPLRYVMHDHTEVSLTAGGGNYPQGIMTHWEIFPRELMGLVEV